MSREMTARASEQLSYLINKVIYHSMKVMMMMMMMMILTTEKASD
jgi:hypothetical protein